jgi:hypothetical protein
MGEILYTPSMRAANGRRDDAVAKKPKQLLIAQTHISCRKMANSHLVG